MNFQELDNLQRGLRRYRFVSIPANFVRGRTTTSVPLPFIITQNGDYGVFAGGALLHLRPTSRKNDSGGGGEVGSNPRQQQIKPQETTRML